MQGAISLKNKYLIPVKNLTASKPTIFSNRDAHNDFVFFALIIMVQRCAPLEARMLHNS